MPLDLSPDLTRRPRTRKVFSEADMIRLRDLYYDRATPLTHVANAFDIPVSTLLRWIAEMDWPKRSAQALPVDARRDLFVQVEAEHQAEQAGARRKRRRPAVTLDRYQLARQVAQAAQMELAALSAEPQPTDLLGRRRRANVIETLSRAVARMERVERERSKNLDRLNIELEKLLKVMRPKPQAQRKKDRPVDTSKPNWWL